MILTYILHILVNRIAKRPTRPNNQTHFHFYGQTQFMLYAHNQEKSERLLNNISRPLNHPLHIHTIYPYARV